MSPTRKIIGFGAMLALVFAVALGLGTVLGPNGALAGNAQRSTSPSYALELAQPEVAAGSQVPLRFRITDGSGAAVAEYVENHEKLLHLIVVRRDLAEYQHVHPVLDGTGTWSVPLNLSNPGDYRVFADFVPADGEAQTLGADVRVPGNYDPQPLPGPATTATVDGYTVTLTRKASELTLSVTQGGKEVTLQPYLGANGHLVALRAADLSYLHVHPVEGPGLQFHTGFPSAGDYRLFFDFKHGDVVRTAEFTVSVAEGHGGH